MVRPWEKLIAGTEYIITLCLSVRYYWILGGAICLVVIMFCLFPLWPKVIRKGSQWLATIAVGFLVVVLAVGVFKYLLFSLLYILSARNLR